MLNDGLSVGSVIPKGIGPPSTVVHKGGWWGNRPILGKWPKFLIQSFQVYNTEFYTISMSYQSDIGGTCIKDEPKTNCIQHLGGLERIAIFYIQCSNWQQRHLKALCCVFHKNNSNHIFSVLAVFVPEHEVIRSDLDQYQ